ncbi:hypothetical protein KSP39_PZI020025 [Platanthera zijinensis]|uniref:Retrotransposon Copia-like N-terminal domain-containing protein n=1 Tax=Platanthera zijinensis TaxID=2320716 RepID=A0AAP0AZA5_9ASPA
MLEFQCGGKGQKLLFTPRGGSYIPHRSFIFHRSQRRVLRNGGSSSYVFYCSISYKSYHESYTLEGSNPKVSDRSLSFSTWYQRGFWRLPKGVPPIVSFSIYRRRRSSPSPFVFERVSPPLSSVVPVAWILSTDRRLLLLLVPWPGLGPVFFFSHWFRLLLLPLVLLVSGLPFGGAAGPFSGAVRQCRGVAESVRECMYCWLVPAACCSRCLALLLSVWLACFLSLSLSLLFLVVVPIDDKLKGVGASEGVGDQPKHYSGGSSNMDFIHGVTQIKLNGKNYLLWAQSMRIFIGSHQILGFLTGSKLAPDMSDPLYEEWEG